ncbi:MAG: hypothetical protein VX899_02355 [Myxococcota bacterium]|nr:hypothetical protein [Myxococcota bacterium]
MKDTPQEPPVDDHDAPERGERGRRPRPSLRGAARRLVEETKTKDLLHAVLDSSDKVKTEAVRQVGREVRTYLEGLGLDDAVLYLLTNYSLEVKASLSLKPIGDALKGEMEEEEDHYQRLRREREAQRRDALARREEPELPPASEDTLDEG